MTRAERAGTAIDTHDLIATALHLRRTHPRLSARATLDMALSTCRSVDLPISAWAANLDMSRSPFGRLLAEAFDGEMSGAEWDAYTGPGADDELRVLIHQRWRERVIAGVSRRYLRRASD